MYRQNNNPFIKFIFVIVILMLIFYISNFSIGISQNNIISEKVPKEFDGFKIVQISDLHSEEFGSNNRRLIKKIDEQEPDVIFMTGDMISTSDKDYSTFLNLSTSLAERYSVYYIEGNHEQNLKEDKESSLMEQISETGAKVLDNEMVTIERNGTSINLYGMWFNLRYYRDLSNDNSKDYYFDIESMKSVLGEADASKYNILLTHNPVYADTYAEWGADLTLSGHLHGGMIYIPFMGGLFSPEKEWFPKYYGGTYYEDDMIMIVNKGLGNGNMGFRVFNMPRINSITLTSQQ